MDLLLFFFVDKGADVNAPDNSKVTPLHMSMASGNVKVRRKPFYPWPDEIEPATKPGCVSWGGQIRDKVDRL